MSLPALCIASLLLLAPLGAEAAIHRSSAARSAFKRLQPCPAAIHAPGRCPGWVIDHIFPLCAGGADAPANMQWQPKPASLVKDRGERALCRALKA